MKTLAVILLLGSASYLVDRQSWITEQQGDSTIIRKMSGTTWTQMYEYDLHGRLLHYSYNDSQFRNHMVNYDPETGEEIGHVVY